MFAGVRPADKRALMISVVIPTWNAEARLAACLAALAPGAIAGLIKEVIVVDAGSADRTAAIAEAAGARLIVSEKGRGGQLAVGAGAARGDLLLFLHADTVLEEGWEEEARVAMDGDADAAVFTLAFDADKAGAALVAWGAMVRTRIFAAPYGDQGLLIRKSVYDALGGHHPLPLMEDVDLMRRFVKAVGRKRLRIFKSRAVTSAERYERDGYAARVLRNFLCVSLFRLGVPARTLVRIYHG